MATRRAETTERLELGGKMSLPLLELEGTAEEIRAQLPDFGGKRLHVTVTPAHAPGPLDAALSAIWQTVPDTSWERFPDDFAAHLDHYLHGTPKKV